MTLNEELLKLEADTAVKREALMRKHAVLSSGLSVLLDGYQSPFIHHSKHYGRVGSIAIHGTDYAPLRDGKEPDAALLRALLDAYPPVPMLLIKDGCTSFRPQQTHGARTGESVEEVYPILCRLDEVDRGGWVKIEWTSRLNGDLWEFSVGFPLGKTNLGRLALKSRVRSGEITSWEHCEFTPSCGNARRIRWASGGRQYPNTFTVYWPKPYEPDIAAFIKETKEE